MNVLRRALTLRNYLPSLRFTLARATMASIASDIKEMEVMNDSDLKDGEK